MNKARIALAIVAAFAVVGGITATKAAKTAPRNAVIYCSTTLETFGTTLRHFTTSTTGQLSYCTTTTTTFVQPTLITPLQ